MNIDTNFYTSTLLNWYQTNRRDLPWRLSNNPYEIWIAEVIFQQTRINQGINYYHRFIERFPNISMLANASEDEVLKLWQGLGYYSRARNLWVTAKKVAFEMQGQFPNTFSEIKKLKGIGDYTAAAIASIAFNEPVTAVDGNVIRVISRLFAIDTPASSSKGKSEITQLAHLMIPADSPGDFNQALMEFGALQCTPRSPNCEICPLKNNCLAFKLSSVEKYPPKNSKKAVRIRYFNYLVIDNGECLLFKKRTSGDIWENLYDFPLIETPDRYEVDTLMQTPQWKKLFNAAEICLENVSDEKTHQLSHQKINVRFYHIKTTQAINQLGFIIIGYNQVLRLPVPIIIGNYLANKVELGATKTDNGN